MTSTLSKTNWIFSIFLGIIGLQMCLGGTVLCWAILFVAGIGFLQNAAYSLQSRARLRDSNFYHALAAIIANFVFFASLRFLVKQSLSLSLLPAYILGTTLGSLNGATLSLGIEKKFGITTVDDRVSKSNQLARFWPTLIFFCVLLAGQLKLIHSRELNIMLTLVILAFLDSFLFSVLSIARNKNNYWYHMIVIIVHSLVKFLSFKIFVNLNMDWVLFIPSTTGSIIGSISGTEFSKVLARWIPASFDNHVKQADGTEIMRYPKIQILFLLCLFIPQFFIFGFFDTRTIILLTIAALIQGLGFALSSRARQRNNKSYIIYASLFSNGIWYFTTNQLVLNKMPLYKLAPFIIGTSLGSLLGQNISMSIEKTIGAVMDTPPPPTLEPKLKT